MAKENFAYIEDKELLQKFYSDSNNYWIGILLQRYTLLLLGVCMKYLKNEEEAKDTVQQIFLKVIGELQKYKVEYFKSWLYMIAKNQCLMKLRSTHNHNIEEINDRTPVEQSSPDNELLEKDKTLTFIEAGLNELNDAQKICVTLFYLKSKSYTEITLATGFNLLQVKSYIQNGKRNLKLIVEQKIKQANG